MKKSINGLLIAAGYSSRMGEFKPLLKFRAKSFVVAIIEKMLSVCRSVVVVSGYNHEALENEINSQLIIHNFSYKNRIIIVRNIFYSQGMFSSLQCGLKELLDSDWILYHFIDQPFHSKRFYNDLISKIDGEFDWIQPTFEGKEGHPVMFNISIAGKILSMTPDSNLRLIRDSDLTKKRIWECSYSSILKDFDTPQDLRSYSK